MNSIHYRGQGCNFPNVRTIKCIATYSATPDTWALTDENGFITSIVEAAHAHTVTFKKPYKRVLFAKAEVMGDHDRQMKLTEITEIGTSNKRIKFKSVDTDNAEAGAELADTIVVMFTFDLQEV